MSSLHNPLFYEQKLVSAINIKGEQIPLNSFSFLYSEEPKTIKIEGMERYSRAIWERCQEYAKRYGHNGPVTCHAFIAQQDSPSFGEHTDPDDVIIYCCEGRKTLTVDGKYIVLEVGDEVFIPASTKHQALNEYAALTLSFGLEKFLTEKAKDYELDPISKDHGDV